MAAWALLFNLRSYLREHRTEVPGHNVVTVDAADVRGTVPRSAHGLQADEDALGQRGVAEEVWQRVPDEDGGE